VIHGRGVQPKCDLFAGVEGGAGKAGNPANRLLKLGRDHSGLK
jgi:hypothetical protein